MSIAKSQWSIMHVPRTKQVGKEANPRCETLIEKRNQKHNQGHQNKK